MSSPGGFGGNAGKKAVHVKWAGKTIALGTFPAGEADEKCARAKALTRAWRSTMRPKPSRDWVMLELERLGVRVVSGRLGRKTGEEGEEEKKGGQTQLGMGGSPAVDRGGWNGDSDLSSLMGNRRGSMAGISSMMNDGRRGSLGSIGQMVGLEGDTLGHQSLGGGFSLNDAQRRSSGLAGLGNLAGSSLGTMGMSVNPNQHYEMLKLHHMNLLNEIQETTLMMNLYQQQQLQQQQQQLQQQANAEGLVGGDHQQQLGLLHAQQNGMDHSGLFSAQLNQQQRASLGLGVSQMGSMAAGSQLGASMAPFGSPQQQQPPPQQHLPSSMEVNSSLVQAASSGASDESPKMDNAAEAPPAQEQKDEDVKASADTKKRSNEDLNDGEPDAKKCKVEASDESGNKGATNEEIAAAAVVKNEEELASAVSAEATSTTLKV